MSTCRLELRSRRQDWHSELCCPVGPSFLRTQWAFAKTFLRLTPKPVVTQDHVRAGSVYTPVRNYVPIPRHLKVFSEYLIPLPLWLK